MAKSPINPEWDSPPTSSPNPILGDCAGWEPDLNPTQRLLFNDPAKYCLAWGEKFSGKSVGCLHALVRHCYENKNALALIIALSIRVGKEGVLYDLEELVLPAWRDGNKYPEFAGGVRHPKAGEIRDSGLGLQFTEAKQDPDTKDRVIWIGNRHGGWSKVILVSVPYSEAVEARIKGPAPSFVYLEEVTNMGGDDYFKYPAAQLGRRRGIEGPMQLYASCNPTGPSHWVYQLWWVSCINQETGLRDPDFSVHHVPVTENLDRVAPGYVERLAQAFKDPIERRRLIDGEWVDRPSGDSIFKNFFAPAIHIRGDALKSTGIIPLRGFPIIVGYDPGPVNFCVALLQKIITKQRSFWWLFDELNFVGQYTPYRRVIPPLLKRFDYWNEKVGSEFKLVHIADEAAFNQVKHDGSYDATEIERLGTDKDGKKRIKLRACPKGKDSVAERISMLTSMWLEEELFISAACPKTVDAIRLISSKKSKPGDYDPSAGLKPVRSVYLHPIDALSYPIFYFHLMPGKFPSSTEAHVQPQAYSAGRG